MRRGQAGGWAMPGVASGLLQAPSESPESWDPGTSSSRHRGGKLHARGLWPEGCPVGPPRREWTQVCVELVQLEDTIAHSPISSESFWKASAMCSDGDWNLN